MNPQEPDHAATGPHTSVAERFWSAHKELTRGSDHPDPWILLPQADLCEPCRLNRTVATSIN